MAENIVIYAGVGESGKRKKKALERDALRETKKGSVSELFWMILRNHGSEELKKDLLASERFRQLKGRVQR